MNFVFISPNYPDNFWMFCRGLKKYGARVLAIVDTPYNMLQPELKHYCDECYVVQSFHNYDDMVRALGYYTFKYGKIDWIESNNEAWLSLDAKLRDDFNVKTGFDFNTVNDFQSKSGMKKYYKEAEIPTARYCVPKTLDEAIAFASEVGYPLVLKPDHGVGASFTYKCKNEQDLTKRFEETKEFVMILEEFIDADVFTLDGICDENGKIVYLSSMEYVGNCMESVNNQTSIGSYTAISISEECKDIAQRTVSAFKLKNRFFHCEFFRLRKAVKGLGKKGTILGLEINFRPPGGICPDLMNYASDIDVYDLWAETLCTQKCPDYSIKKYACGFAGRRFSENYQYTAEELQSMYGSSVIYVKTLSAALAAGMGDELIVSRFKTEKEIKKFMQDAFKLAE